MLSAAARRRSTAALGSLTLLLAGLAGPLPSAAAGTVSLVGEVQRLAVELRDGTHVDLTAVVPADGSAVRVDTQDLAAVPTGATVALRLDRPQAGDQDAAAVDGGTAALSVAVLDAPQTEALVVPGSMGRTVGVLTALLPGQSADSVTTGTLASDVSGVVSPYWSDSTDAAVGFTVGGQTVAGTYSGWGATSTCLTSQVSAFLSWTAQRAGVSPTINTQRHTLTYSPELPACEFAGVANVSDGGSAWVNGAVTAGDRQYTEVHELGHTLGLGHSNTRYGCATGVDGSASDCTDVDYGDAYDVMGFSIGGAGPLSAAHLDTLGLLDADSTRDVSGPADVTLAPVASGAGLRAVRFRTGGATYYVEFRGAVGRDADLATSRQGCPTDWRFGCSPVRFTPGVTVHRVDATGLGADAWLLPAGAGGAFVMSAGDSFTTADGQVRIAVGSISTSSARILVSGGVAPARADGRYVPVNPSRVFDRVVMGPRSTYTFTVPGVPAGATMVVLNLTVTGVKQTSYLSACAAGTPLAVCRSTSALNPTAGVDTASSALVALGGPAGNQVTLYNNAGTLRVIADLEGFYVPGAASGGALYEARAPSRAMDRTFTARETYTLTLPNVPANAVAVAVNVTSSAPSAVDYVSVCPAGVASATCRSTSTVNPTPGRDIANVAVVRLGGPHGDQLQVYNNAGRARLIVDVSGYFVAGSTTGSALQPLVPTRVLDRARLGPRQHLTLTLSGVPAGATAVVLNLTSTATTGTSFVSACPGGMSLTSCTRTSVFNPAGGVDSSNNAYVVLGGPAHNQVLLYNNGAAMSLIADAVAYFVPPA